MAIFKYTVANKEGKKLSGTVEAPDEKIARTELNNLGFSILLLQETKIQPQIDSSLTKFVFESLDKNSRRINGTIPAADTEQALEKLHKEYNVTVMAIWPEDASPEEIEEARKKGAENLRDQLKNLEPTSTAVNVVQAPELSPQEAEELKNKAIIKTKIEHALTEINTLLQKFDQEINAAQKSEINKRINKILRIKNSTNLEYVLKEAEDLLIFIQEQEKSMQQQGHEEKRFELRMETQKLLSELKQGNAAKTLSEDVIEKIRNWQKIHIQKATEIGGFTKFINSILVTIQGWFETPPEVLEMEAIIKNYNKQLWDFAFLYFKEPTADYKARVKNSIKTVWQARKDAKLKLKEVKKSLKAEKKPAESTNLLTNFLEEVNAFSGWLLAFYVLYYFVGLYITTKDFGLDYVPPAFFVYETVVFKHILVILFLLHISTALKINVFKKNLVADVLLVPFFIFSSLIVIFNF